LTKSYHDVKKVNQLLPYADVYKRPSRFIEAYDDDTELGEIREPLVSTFARVNCYKGVLTAALNAGERSKTEAMKTLLNINSAGFHNIKNTCDFCSQNLLPKQKIDTYIARMTENEHRQ